MWNIVLPVSKEKETNPYEASLSTSQGAVVTPPEECQDIYINTKVRWNETSTNQEGIAGGDVRK